MGSILPVRENKHFCASAPPGFDHPAAVRRLPFVRISKWFCRRLHSEPMEPSVKTFRDSDKREPPNSRGMVREGTHMVRGKPPKGNEGNMKKPYKTNARTCQCQASAPEKDSSVKTSTSGAARVRRRRRQGWGNGREPVAGSELESLNGRG